MHKPALLGCWRQSDDQRRCGQRRLLDWLKVIAGSRLHTGGSQRLPLMRQTVHSSMTAPLEDACQADRAAWSWLLSRIWAIHVATGRAWLRALCRPALVAFVALFALTLPTAHLHGPSDAQRHIAVHWHGLPLLDAVLVAGQRPTHQHVHTPVGPLGPEASVGVEAGPATGAASEQRQTSPWHAMGAASQSLTYLHSVLPLPQPVLAVLDSVWPTDAFWPPDVSIPPPETPPRVLLTT